ncbi:CRISPR system precrRNA processing endoribonuclease RAMP protein Cas6, partial [Oscillochloris sp. ZM17-4]|uniref:CRISPR system precrRNA processing endoribonuclease RAMP protein Cas6 n=1 Tax=Oscillochloris sp. ZM17-4 TaxID=2866714 RepID=UPI001C731855
MPTAMIYTIRPRAAASVPSSLGRATHAAILRLIQAADPALSARIHDDEGVKPLTVSNVQGLGPGRFSQARPERDYTMRVTLLSAELEAIAAGWTPEALGELDLDGHAWQVLARADDPAQHDWASHASYEQIAAPLLDRPADLPMRWDIQFASPVTFRRRGVNLPFPMPELVFGSLLDKWNAFAPISLPDEVRRFAEERLAVSRYELRTLAGPTSGGALQIGAVGRCTYVAVGHDRYWQACITTLARYARYAGIGAGTA